MGGKNSKTSDYDDERNNTNNNGWWSQHELATTSHPNKYTERNGVLNQIDDAKPVYIVYTKAQLDATSSSTFTALLLGSLASLIVGMVSAIAIFHYQETFKKEDANITIRQLRKLQEENRE